MLFWKFLLEFPQRYIHTKIATGQTRGTERKKPFSNGKRLGFPENDKGEK